MGTCHEQRQQTTDRGYGNVCQNQQRPLEGFEHRVKKDEDDENGYRENNQQASVGPLLAGVFPLPIDAVSERQLHLLVNLFHCLLYRAAEISPTDAVLNGDIATIAFAIDLRTAILFFDLAKLGQRYALACGGEQANVLDRLLGGPILREVAENEVIASFALQDLGERIAPNRSLYRVLNVRDIDLITCCSFSVDCDIQVGLAKHPQYS